MPHTAGGTPALPTELPVFNMRGTAKGVEEGAGGGGGTIATGIGPGLGPVDIMLAGGGLDGQLNEALEEVLPGRGSWLPVRRNV